MDPREETCALGDMDLCKIAIAAGIGLPNGIMPPELRDYTRAIAEHAASVVEHWTDEDTETSAADEIRAAFGIS